MNIKFFKKRRLQEKWLEKGRIKERKLAQAKSKRKLSEFNEEQDELHNEYRKKLAEIRRNSDLETAEFGKTLSDVRKTQAAQLRLLRKMYFDKLKTINDLIDSNQKRQEHLNRRHAEFNDFLGKVVSRFDKVKKQHETLSKEQAIATREVGFVKEMEHEFLSLVSTGKKPSRISLTS